ncbi:MAG: tetratricopeptide repeat protein, partial [Microcystaceae cyanobacterium]
KQDDQAIALYDTASQVNPTDFRPLLSKALVLQKQGKNDLASSLFQQALMIAPVQYKDTIKKMAIPSIGNPESPKALKP